MLGGERNTDYECLLNEINDQGKNRKAINPKTLDPEP